MTRQARNWAAAAALLLLLAGGTLAFGQVTGTFAIFNAEAKNPNNVLDGGWVPQPTPTSTALVNSGTYSQMTLNWTAGAAPPVTGQTIKYASGGTGASSSCPAAGSGSYSAFSTPATGVGTATVTGNNISDWWCFEISANASNWSTDWLAFTPARRLFVATGLSLNNHTGGTVGQIEQLDTIAITFNQPPSDPGTTTVSTTTSSITIGGVGTISGGNLVVGANRNYTGSSSSVTGNVLTIVINGGSGVTSHATTVTGSGTLTFGTFTSSGGTNLCTAAACALTSSSDF
ncbi:MAG TPA: hypothetical protein VGH92_10830 [Gaiellaceae bacterium]